MPNLTQEHINIHDFIDRIEFTPILTGITYKDGSGSFAVCSEEDIYDPEKGFAFALLNRIFGHNLWKDYVRKFSPKVNETQNIKDKLGQLEAQKVTLENWINFNSTTHLKKIEELSNRIKDLEEHNECLREELDRYELAYTELEDKFNKMCAEKEDEEKEEEDPSDILKIKSARLREILSNMNY